MKQLLWKENSNVSKFTETKHRYYCCMFNLNTPSNMYLLGKMNKYSLRLGGNKTGFVTLHSEIWPCPPLHTGCQFSTKSNTVIKQKMSYSIRDQKKTLMEYCAKNKCWITVLHFNLHAFKLTPCPKLQNNVLQYRILVFTAFWTHALSIAVQRLFFLSLWFAHNFPSLIFRPVVFSFFLFLLAGRRHIFFFLEIKVFMSFL